MNEILFNLLLVTAIVCGTLFTSVIVPYVRQQIKGTKYEDVIKEIAEAVRAAEQSPFVKPIGTEKKNYVMNYMSEWLTGKGIKISAEQLDMLIEAAVYSMQNE